MIKFAILLLAVVGNALAAQEVDSIRAAVFRKALGSPVRVSLDDGRRIEGILQLADSAGLEVISNNERISAVRIDTLWTKQRFGRKGAAIGAGAGLAASAVFLYGLATNCGPGDDPCTGLALAVPLLATEFTLVGALAGFVIGHFTTRWERKLP